jgi:Ni,Fe-hydrogenase I large subunit
MGYPVSINNEVDPISRIEGHLGVAVVTSGGTITNAFAHGNLWRGFENFLLGRDINDAITFTQRICGVCPVPHGMTSTFCTDTVLGYSAGHITFSDHGVSGANGVPPKAVSIRNLVLGAEFLMSSITHFYHLAAPSYIQGPNIAPWTPYFADSYYTEIDAVKASMRSHGKITPLTDATDGFTDGLWSSVIRSYVLALRIRRLTFEAAALFAGRMPMTSSLVGGGVTFDGTEDLTTRANTFESVITEVGHFIIEEYVPIALALGVLYKPYDNVHNGGSGIGSGLGRFLAWGAFPNPDTDALALAGGYSDISDSFNGQFDRPLVLGPGGWVVDRKAPGVFEAINGLLHIGIVATDQTVANYTNTQGRGLVLPAGVTSVSADVQVPSDIATHNRRSDLWLAGVDASGNDFTATASWDGWTAIGFLNDDGLATPDDQQQDPASPAVHTPHFRVYDFLSDTVSGYWHDIPTATIPVVPGAWYNLKVVLTPSSKVEYYINGTLVYTMTLTGSIPMAQFKSANIEAWNFGQSYDVYWDNLETPVGNFRVSNKAQVASKFLAGGMHAVPDNLTEDIASSRYDIDTRDTAAYNKTTPGGTANKAAYPGDVSRTKPKRSNGYTYMKAPRWNGKSAEVGPMARMFVNGLFQDNVALATSLGSYYTAYVKTASGNTGLNPAMISADVAVAVFRAGLATIRNATVATALSLPTTTDFSYNDVVTHIGAIATLLGTTGAHATVAKAYMNADTVITGAITDWVLAIKAGASTMDRLRARAIESLYLVQQILGTYTPTSGTWTGQSDRGSFANNGWVAQLRAETGGANDTSTSTWKPKSIPSGVVQGWGGTEAPRGALMHQATISAGKITKYQCIVPTTWNGSPCVGDSTVKGNHGAIEAAVIGAPFAATNSPFPGVASGTVNSVGGVEVLRIAQSFDPCIACAVH